MLQHVGIEVAPGGGRALGRALGAARLRAGRAAESLAEFTWLERAGTQIHLMPTESPTVPPSGHVAVVVPDFDGTFERLAAAGFEIERRREHWGAPRAKATAPGGHIVELMAVPAAGRLA